MTDSRDVAIAIVTKKYDHINDFDVDQDPGTEVFPNGVWVQLWVFVDNAEIADYDPTPE